MYIPYSSIYVFFYTVVFSCGCLCQLHYMWTVCWVCACYDVVCLQFIQS